MSHLAPCSACDRHVRVSEAQCPFCGTDISLAPRPALARAGLKRAALFALGATLSATACGEDDDSTDEVSQQQMGNTGGGAATGGAPATGGTPATGGAGEENVGTAGAKPGGELPLPQPVYGAPVEPLPEEGTDMSVDAGTAATSKPLPLPQPVYGAVPPPEAEQDD